MMTIVPLLTLMHRELLHPSDAVLVVIVLALRLIVIVHVLLFYYNTLLLVLLLYPVLRLLLLVAQRWGIITPLVSNYRRILSY